MKKITMGLVIILILSVFIYGLLVGTYKFFPYELLDYSKEIILNEKTGIDNKNISYEKNVKSLIHINSKEDIINKKEALVDFIWKGEGFPISKMPNKIQKNVIDSRYENLVNLKRIDQINILMEHEVNSISYLFIPENSNNILIIYHEGHAGDFYKGKKTIQFFLENGYTVLAFSMPLLGMNNQPIIELDNLGTIKLISHEHFRFIESTEFSPIKYFVEPIAVSLNYIDKEFDFDSYYMVGISGGGWTVTLYSALDDRIVQSYSVAGSVPIYLRSTPMNRGDYEQWLPDLYRITNYLDLYIMSSYGEDRKFIQIFNQYDTCCFAGDHYKSYENEIKMKISMLEKGKFEIYLDDTHKKHQISEYALQVMIGIMENSKLQK